MRWLHLPAACIAIWLAAVPTPLMAATATSDLMAGPPSSDWQVDPQTGPMSKEAIYGTDAGKVDQFVDAYRSVWTAQTPRRIMADRLEHYSSTVWAAFRYGQSHGASLKNKQHSSVNNVSGFGPNAYEVTDPVDASGFLRDSIIFQQGDYLAVISLYDMTQPDHAMLLDQAKRQFDLVPQPVAEYNAIGHGIVVTIIVVVLALLAIAIIAGAIVLIVTQRRRGPQLQPAAVLRMSPDRTYWWDGRSWQDASRRMPAGAQLSPDGMHWWDGVSWRPRPPA